MKYEELSKQIIEKVGGVENVKKVTHCSTRLRFQLNDLSKIDKEGLKNIPEVPGIKDQKGGIQVIIGQQVILLKIVFSVLPKEFYVIRQFGLH